MVWKVIWWGPHLHFQCLYKSWQEKESIHFDIITKVKRSRHQNNCGWFKRKKKLWYLITVNHTVITDLYICRTQLFHYSKRHIKNATSKIHLLSGQILRKVIRCFHECHYIKFPWVYIVLPFKKCIRSIWLICELIDRLLHLSHLPSATRTITLIKVKTRVLLCKLALSL